MVPANHSDPFHKDWVELGATITRQTGWKLSPSGRRYFTGEGSPFTKFREREGPFITRMTELEVLRRQDRDVTSPRVYVGHRFTQAFEDASWPEHTSLYTQAFAKREDAEEKFRQLARNLGRCEAMADLVLMMALDVCALLGGRVYPVWPPNPNYRGCFVNTYKELPGKYLPRDEQGRRAMVRRLERYGVPLYGMTRTRGTSRLDLGRDGRAVEGSRTEERHQRMLERHAQGENVKITDHGVPLQSRQLLRTFDPRAGHLPTGPTRQILQRAIISLLDVHSPSPITFERFSSIVEPILPYVWSTELYESALHPATVDPRTKAPWYRVREGLHECGHIGAMVAAFQVPFPWTDSNTTVASSYGKIPLTYDPQSTQTIVEEPVEKSLWHLIGLRNFGDAKAGEDFANNFIAQGVLGCKIYRDPQGHKDEEGRSTKVLRLRMDLIFKSRRMRDNLLAEILRQYPNLLPQPMPLNEADPTWQQGALFPFNPGYMAFLYTQPLPSDEREVLRAIAPRYGLKPVGAIEDAERRMEGKRLIHNLRHVELFECESFPPLTSQTTVPLRPFDMAACPLNLLVNMAFSPGIKGLSTLEVQCFQRMVLVLQTLEESKMNRSFMAHLLPSKEGPHATIMRFIVNTLSSRPTPESSFFHKRLPGANTSRYEALRLTNEGYVEVFVDLEVAPEDVPRPTKQQVEDHYANLARLLEGFIASKSLAERRYDRKRRVDEPS